MDIAGKGDLPRVPKEEFERDADGPKTPCTRMGTHEDIEEGKEKKRINLDCCGVTHIYTAISVSRNARCESESGRAACLYPRQ